MNEKTRVAIESGIVPGSVVDQMRRWGFVFGDLPSTTLSDPKEIAERFQQAVEGDDSVQLRDTDLDIVKQYLSRQTKGRLYVPTPEGKMTFVDVYYCKTDLGEYVIPWQNESIRDLLLDPDTYLKLVGKGRVYFGDVRDLYFGDTKAFVVCVPASQVKLPF